ncbi:CLUMA_CG017276, isoform A [Clunio marinus]|uniref:CLUMA_CG017276, isoform A n=1 Tax=Clunio marinus TaxID=568069 RepID=A0A1J1IVC7_9DIPT|nr:CLUMA_CG017276, isoform A [Clunio marinus]
MKFVAITLFALIAAVYSAPVQVSDNNVGDIVTVGINANAKIKSDINQDIFSVIAAFKNYQSIRLGGSGILSAPAAGAQGQPDFEITPEMIEQFKTLIFFKMAEEVAETSLEVTSLENEEQERAELQRYVDELNEKIKQKSEMREKNLNRQLPPESYFTKLDSSLKKNTAFVKKLKQFTAAQLDSLLKDMTTLNLSKYISEVSQAIVEAKLKMTDIPAVLTLCSKLHTVYGEFSQHFFENWQKMLTIKHGEKVQNASKLRVDLRLYCELLSIGIFPNKLGLPLLGSILTNLIAQDKEEHSNLSIILSFCKHVGEEYAGLTSRRILLLAKKFEVQLPASTLLTAEKQHNVRNLLRDYHQTVCKHLKHEHKELQSAEQSKRRAMESHGEISNRKREQLEMMTSNYDKLLQSTITLSDILNENMPELPKEETTTSEGNVIEGFEDSSDVQLDPWGDEDTKSFYVDLPDLRQFLPNYHGRKEPSEPLPEVEQVTEEALDDETVAEPELNVEEQEIMKEIEEEESKPDEKSLIDKGTDEGEEDETSAEIGDSDKPSMPEKTQILGLQQLRTFLANLLHCVNREQIDSAAIEFLLNFNNKPNRKRLVKALFGVHRTRLDLLPFFARFCAIVNLVSPDVALELSKLLKVDFKFHVKKRDQLNIESKIKVVRYIGEMVKFTLYSRLEGLMCLKYLLSNFQHHHIEMTCAFLEVCGMYLYNCKDSRLRTSVYLEQMMRLKKAMTLDTRHSTQIENCYYLVKPPEGGMQVRRKIRTPMQMYIRYLIFQELHKGHVEKIVKYVRRLDWDDPEISEYVIKCLTKAYKFRWHLIRPLADFVSALSSYQERAVMRVIDGVFEDIRAGLEIHSPKLAQRRIAMTKYLGELYLYRLIDSKFLFNTLYSIICYGVSWNHEISSPVDPPESMFRLKLACTLLDTCGSYFQGSTSKKRLNYYLVFLQGYYWFKKSHPVFVSTAESGNLFPHLIEHMYKECLHNLRPKMKLFKSYEEAQEEVEKLRLEHFPNAGGEQGDGDGRSLGTINENESDYTSEALVESDDDIQIGKSEIDDDDDNDGDDNENDDDDDEEFNEDEDEDDDEVEDEKSQEQKEPEKSEEDLQFEAMFEKMAADSYHERIKETSKVNTRDIPVPMTTRVGKKTYDQLQDDSKPTDAGVVPFVLMVRNTKSGKQQFKNFVAPSDSELAVNLKMQELKIKEENERVKRLTLNITERLEEEDYQESLQKSPAFNKRPKFKPYKHQFGVPDTDNIFH